MLVRNVKARLVWIDPRRERGDSQGLPVRGPSTDRDSLPNLDGLIEQLERLAVSRGRFLRTCSYLIGRSFSEGGSSMKSVRLMVASGIASVLFFSTALAQQPPKPGPEHERLKKLEGAWDATIKVGDQQSKGTMTYKMELGGLWLVSEFPGDFMGMKFQGKGMDGYDPLKKKYVSVWVDSMSNSPLISEGTLDKDGKVLTMSGEGLGMDGKPV